MTVEPDDHEAEDGGTTALDIVHALLCTPSRQILLQRLDHLVGAEAVAIDLKILEDALHVVARLRQRDRFDPIDHIDAIVARIAV